MMGGFTPAEFEALCAGLELLVYGRTRDNPDALGQAKRLAAARDLLACIETLKEVP